MSTEFVPIEQCKAAQEVMGTRMNALEAQVLRLNDLIFDNGIQERLIRIEERVSTIGEFCDAVKGGMSKLLVGLLLAGAVGMVAIVWHLSQ